MQPSEDFPLYAIENKIKEGKNKIEDFMVKKHEENMKKTKKSKRPKLVDNFINLFFVK